MGSILSRNEPSDEPGTIQFTATLLVCVDQLHLWSLYAPSTYPLGFIAADVTAILVVLIVTVSVATLTKLRGRDWLQAVAVYFATIELTRAAFVGATVNLVWHPMLVFSQEGLQPSDVRFFVGLGIAIVTDIAFALVVGSILQSVLFRVPATR